MKLARSMISTAKQTLGVFRDTLIGVVLLFAVIRIGSGLLVMMVYSASLSDIKELGKHILLSLPAIDYSAI